MSTGHLRRRSARVIPALIVAVVIIAFAVALIWWAVAALTSGQPTGATVAESISKTSFSTPAALIVAGGLGIIGIMLLLIALIPGTRRIITLAGERIHQPSTDVVDGRVDLVITTAGVANLAAAAADTVDGVDSVNASAKPGRVRIIVSTHVRDHSEICRQVRKGAAKRLREAGLKRVPRVNVAAKVKEF